MILPLMELSLLYRNTSTKPERYVKTKDLPADDIDMDIR